jgi:hypothetical protein
MLLLDRDLFYVEFNNYESFVIQHSFFLFHFVITMTRSQ